MSHIGQKYSYEGPRGKCSVVVIKGGRILETRRDGKTFIKCDHPYGAWHLSATEQRKWATEEEWRASLPANTVTKPPSRPTEAAVLGRAIAAIRGTIPHRYTGAFAVHEELGIPWNVAVGVSRRAEIINAATVVDEALAEKACVPLEIIREALAIAPPALAVTEKPAAPSAAAAAADPEATFLHRIRLYTATRLDPKPSAKDEAWGRRDRAAYDAADPAPRWAMPTGHLFLWLTVQHGDAFIPVCHTDDSKILRFLVDGALVTMAEAGIRADAPIWRRKSEEDPTLVRVP
jgi:hypothetical protein